MTKLKRLRELGLEHNSLTSLPSHIDGMLDLETLEANYNQLERLPLRFGELKRLRILGLEHNCLSCLPNSFTKLDRLRFAGLDNNRISHLPSTLSTLKRLRTFSLKGNPCVDGPARCGSRPGSHHSPTGGAGAGADVWAGTGDGRGATGALASTSAGRWAAPRADGGGSASYVPPHAPHARSTAAVGDGGKDNGAKSRDHKRAKTEHTELG